MAQISTFLKKRLSDSMKNRALGDDELRGIDGVHGHYFSKQPKNGDSDHLFSTEIDDVLVYVFKVPVA